MARNVIYSKIYEEIIRNGVVDKHKVFIIRAKIEIAAEKLDMLQVSDELDETSSFDSNGNTFDGYDDYDSSIDEYSDVDECSDGEYVLAILKILGYFLMCKNFLSISVKFSRNRNFDPLFRPCITPVARSKK